MDVENQVSVHIVFDEHSRERDRLTAEHGIRISGMSCTYAKEDDVGRSDRAAMMSSATWIIIVCCHIKSLSDTTMLSFEENVALFMACMNGVRNVIYVLGDGVSPIAAKGFLYFLKSGDYSYIENINSVLRNPPLPIDTDMFETLCCHLDESAKALFSEQSLTWELVGADGTDKYKAKMEDGGVKMVRLTDPDLHSNNMKITTNWGTVRHIHLLPDTTNAMIVQRVGPVAALCVDASLFAVLIYVAHAILLTDNTQLDYFPVILLQLVCVVMSGLLAIFARNSNVRLLTVYQTVLSLVVLVFQILHWFNMLPLVLALPVVCCAPVLGSWLGMDVLYCLLFDANFAYFCLILNTMHYLILTVLFRNWLAMLYESAGYSFEVCFLVVSVILITQMGMFLSLIMFVKIHTRKFCSSRSLLVTYVMCFLIFIYVWFGVFITF